MHAVIVPYIEGLNEQFRRLHENGYLQVAVTLKSLPMHPKDLISNNKTICSVNVILCCEELQYIKAKIEAVFENNDYKSFQGYTKQYQFAQTLD